MSNAKRIAELDAEIAAIGAQFETHSEIQNEGREGYNPHEAKLMALAGERSRLMIEDEDAARIAVWTLEVTKTRRIEWNAFIRSIATAKGVSTTKVVDREIEQGWTAADLRAAIKRHGL